MALAASDANVAWRDTFRWQLQFCDFTFGDIRIKRCRSHIKRCRSHREFRARADCCKPKDAVGVRQRVMRFHYAARGDERPQIWQNKTKKLREVAVAPVWWTVGKTK